ncbi:hypothetical protein CLOM_g22338 [Closterium sp. NIES-68]|nr:hypothetical protein CLOM_g22338 [Closterium sp. NIES-68]GJP76162.1 hypothetical protein CLOP_g6533 [Closterium sp. NIES-67]
MALPESRPQLARGVGALRVLHVVLGALVLSTPARWGRADAQQQHAGEQGVQQHTPANTPGSVSPQPWSSIPQQQNPQHQGGVQQPQREVQRWYLDNSELESFLRGYVDRCSHMARLYSIGRSVLGVPLWVLLITLNPGDKRPRFTFKYIGGVHGDEPLGRQLLLYLADWLCANYPAHPAAREIVEGMELHVLPAMNPDGFALHTRENANRIDLNRAFPDPWFPAMNAAEAGRQAEVRAVMRWTQRHHFSASASLHGGALVASYAWDGTKDKGTHYAASPDDATFRLMASTYASSHPTMGLSRDFPGGITNGASWYPLYGGMQDWNYVVAHCMEITLELHIAKWPAPILLPQLWEEHRPAMLALLTTTAKMGVQGTVLSAATSAPLPAAIIVHGIEYNVVASKRFGDFYRLLPPGNYTVTVCHPAHINHTTNVTVLPNQPTLLRILLRPTFPPSNSAPSIFQTRSAPRSPHPLGLSAWLPWHWGSRVGADGGEGGVRRRGRQAGGAGPAEDPSLVLPARQQAAAAAAAAAGVLSSEEVMWAVGMGSSAALAAAVLAVLLLAALLMMVGQRRRRLMYLHRGVPLRVLSKV